MRSNLFAAVVCALPLLSIACASADSVSTQEDESSLTSSSNPGLPSSVGASDGPFRAYIQTTVDAAGATRTRLSVTYAEPYDRSFLLCERFPRQPKLPLVLTFGSDDNRRSISREMEVSCPRSYGDNGGATNSASWGVTAEEDPQLWDTLFPRRPNGTRWYALRVAATNAAGTWDSRYGHDYRLVMTAP